MSEQGEPSVAAAFVEGDSSTDRFVDIAREQPGAHGSGDAGFDGDGAAAPIGAGDSASKGSGTSLPSTTEAAILDEANGAEEVAVVGEPGASGDIHAAPGVPDADDDEPVEDANAADDADVDGVAEAGDGADVDGGSSAADELEPEAEDSGDPVLEDPAELAAAVEAILFVVDLPLSVAALASALRQPTPAIETALASLRAGYDERSAGIELRDAAGGVRIYTRPVYARHVERFLQDGQRSRLSQAALETLAVIAYRQPVTRSRVSAIRGVNVDGVVRTLLSRGLIVEVGSDPESGAGLFRTSELFLERMGMQTLDELPSLAPLLPDLEGLETEEL
ncbi:SMC-Scp complex subunit ScpB [Jatrophihabitans sp.]|uniref:SMC-Scp complex subunit ScpB n=1 Tax=Jatrophihabitans sp. TaxID=1932789 RepID=UPI0030C68F69|nr:Condensin subunit ScpB [Jatrophihabitans sp.]